MNVYMKGGLVRGCGFTFRNTSEECIREPPLHEQGGAESSHGNVEGVWLTHKVGAPWDEETGRDMPHQFGGGFQGLVEVLEVSSYIVSYPD